MNKRLIGLLVIITLINFETVQSQSNYQLPTIIPPSPAVQNFLRYGEIPVDYSTGVPNISVPLYTVKSRKLELPIAISYHASGIKVEDRASVIGLGWVLNAGGLVAVSAISLPDPIGYGPGQISWANSDSFYSQLNRVSKVCNFGSSGQPDSFITFGQSVLEYSLQYKDWVSDRYSYQLPNGESGTFRYDFHTHQLIKLPYNAIKIHADTAVNGTIPSFTITDTKGVTYIFKLPPDYPVGVTVHNNWDLTTIISADKTDTIRLVYKTDQNKYYTPSYTSRLQFGDLASGSNDPPYYSWAAQALFSNSLSPATLYTSERILDSIISSNTVVKVTAIGDRSDMPTGFGKFRVNKLSVYERSSGNLIKDFVFNQSYFGSQAGAYRLRLDSLSVRGSDTIKVQTYKFKYNTLELPPYPDGGSPTFSEDYWGYNNNSQTSSLIPYEFVPNSVINQHGGSDLPMPGTYIGNRDPDHYYAKAALLEEIRYPTGGKTVFEFEPNHSNRAFQYPGNTLQPGNVGGFRVKKISNYSDSSVLSGYKTYSYSDGNTRTINQELFAYGARTFMGPSSGYCTMQYDWVWTNILSSPFLPLTCDNGPPIFYESVTEYEGDTSGVIGKTVYSYETPPTTNYASYDEVRFQDPYEYDRGNYIPKLLSKEIYKKENGQYTPVQITENYYSSFLSQPHFMGIHAVQTSDYIRGGNYLDYGFCSGAGCYLFHAGELLGYPYYFKMIDLYATQEINPVTKTIVYDYGLDTSQKLTTTTFYTYDTTSHIQPIQQITISSKGDSLKTVLKYPKNYAGIAAYDSMIARNIITPVITQSKYKNSTFLDSVKTNYYNWTSSFVAPQTVESKVQTNNSDTRLRFIAYDSKGNILSVSKENDMKMSYLWDYNNSYPIAEVVNADTGSFAYTSFEADGKGGWTYSGSTSSDATSPTGKRCYNTNNGNITKTGLTNTTYIISYWGKTGSVNINSAAPTRTGMTIGSWTYYEHEITTTSITVSGNKYIDELRLYPKGALMTTYTYSPLIGATSQCDVNNRITYYEYDPFNRLTAIRDQDHHVVKKICYNYAGQPENCDTTCTYTGADWQFVANYRCQTDSLGQNTTYKEQEQKDMNACSPTYNQSQWSVVGIDSTTCPPTARITSTNSTGLSGYTAVYTNTKTSAVYTFSIPSSGSLQTLGLIPFGKYNLTISKSGGGVLPVLTFGSGCSGMTTDGTSATFNNINVSTSNCNSITMAFAN